MPLTACRDSHQIDASLQQTPSADISFLEIGKYSCVSGMLPDLVLGLIFSAFSTSNFPNLQYLSDDFGDAASTKWPNGEV